MISCDLSETSVIMHEACMAKGQRACKAKGRIEQGAVLAEQTCLLLSV